MSSTRKAPGAAYNLPGAAEAAEDAEDAEDAEAAEVAEAAAAAAAVVAAVCRGELAAGARFRALSPCGTLTNARRHGRVESRSGQRRFVCSAAHGDAQVRCSHGGGVEALNPET